MTSTTKTICVTGASGFIASHVIRELLSRGHVVRGTVRDSSDDKKTAHLRAIAEDAGAADRLTLHGANLLDEGSFDSAIAGCDVVCHMAAAVILAADNPQKDIVDPSVAGCANVLGAIERAGTVKRVVHTSSVAAVQRYLDAPGHTFTEADWNTEATLATDPYGLAKTEAERAMWRAHEAADGAWQLVTINPALVLGPVYTRAHCKGSAVTIRDLIGGGFPALPPVSFGVVDVREVAFAHAEAIERDDASGRHILYAEGRHMHELATTLRRDFPDIKIPRLKLPVALMYLATFFDKRLSRAMVRRLTNNPVTFDNRRSKEALGVVYRPIDESIGDTVRSMVDGGLVRAKRR